MLSNRVEAFTDGVLAIVITIMVLELPVPKGHDFAALTQPGPVLLAYLLSFVNVALYWNNHHHLFQATEHVDGRALWANMFLLFWLSLVPFVIRWLDEAGFTQAPTVAYGFVLGMAAVGWQLTQRALIRCNGPDSPVARAATRSRKEWWSLAAYGAGIALTFVHPAIAIAIYVGIALAWFVPDRRLEREVEEETERAPQEQAEIAEQAAERAARKVVG